MKIFIVLFLVLTLNGQVFNRSEKSLYYLESLEISEDHLSSVFSMNSKNASKLDKTNPLTPALYSLIIPGLGQYKNGDKYAPYVFLGLEIASWYLYSAMNSKGDDKKLDVRNFANDPNTGFNRVLYYKRVYEKAKAEGGAAQNYDSYFTSYNNEEERYQNILSNKGLWENLKKWEHDYGDHTHSLPETKTQQYYEMIGKYDQFESGWLYTKGDSRYSFYSTHTQNHQPGFIRNYYDLRQDMNSYYKTGDWALRAIFANHIVSAIEALITARKKNKTVDLKYSNKMNYLGLKEEKITLSYHF